MNKVNNRHWLNNKLIKHAIAYSSMFMIGILKTIFTKYFVDNLIFFFNGNLVKIRYIN